MKLQTIEKLQAARNSVNELKADFSKSLKETLKELGIGAVYRWVIFQVLSKPKVRAKFDKFKALIQNIDQVGNELGI